MDSQLIIIVLTFFATISGVIAFGKDSRATYQQFKKRPLSWYWSHISQYGKSAGVFLLAIALSIVTYGNLTFLWLLLIDKANHAPLWAVAISFIGLSALSSICFHYFDRQEGSLERVFLVGFIAGSMLGIYFAIAAYDPFGP